ncbi:MAG: twitching motility protein PilT [Candidatus Aminicenantes bacterium RBG_19FT_COMBO_58_17]|nr:MAG: twitching motility protein PilT [Candidatus Aminicenantes bacterium RBG_19FT_COMBO_58_17]
MKVIVDTSVWSLALRRHAGGESAETRILRGLVLDRKVQMLGPIRQEILSGVRSTAYFRELRDRLASFPDLSLTTEDYVKAAEFFNACRSKGIQGSNTDFLLCSVSARTAMPIFTTDKDFSVYAGHLPIRLFSQGD